MAVTSGSCYSSYGRNSRFRVDWERTGTWNDNSGCGSIIRWKLVLENGNQWYSNAIKCYAIYINGSKVSDGGTWSNYTSSGNYTLIDWQSNVRIAHNNAGNEKTFNINYTGWFYSSYNVSASTDFTLPSIPRQTKITSFTVAKRNETSLTFNWATADTIDYLWYSTNNGSSWTGYDTADGTSGSFTVSGLSPNTTYNCKIRVRRKDSQLTTDSSQVSQTTYKAPTQALSSKTETSITMSWSIDSAASQIRYSSNNGSSWSSWINVSGTSGTYTISSLSPNTTYNIKTEVKRSATGTSYATSASSQTTYAYPYLTEAPNFTIGNSLTVKFYNPLNRSLQIQMYSHVAGAFVTDLISCSGTSYTFTPNASRLYASIPNTTSSGYNIDVWYNSNKAVGNKGTSYSVNTSACIPTFTNFEYKDTADNLLTQAIDNDQVIVQNVSNVNVVISSANKMVAKNSATASKYQALFSNLSKTFNYSASDIDTYLGIPTGSGNSTFKVTAYDSRNISKEVSKTINIIPYSAPLVNVVLARLNNFEAETHLKLSGTFARVTISNVDKNAIQEVKYRYKESSASTWGSWTTMTIQSQGSGNYQTTEVTLSLDNTKQFTFEFQVTDKAKTTSASQVLSIGEPLMFLHTSGKLELNGPIETEGATINGNTTISGNNTVSGNATINGNTTTATLTSNGNTTIGQTNGTTSFQIHGGSGSNIYWKEYGFGDQFRIIPEFGGADDSNKLRIQGAVGGSGETPTLYDLMTISGKNGNLSIKGNLTVSNWTRNTSDTWMPVIKNGTLEYTQRKIVSAKTHTDYNNNQDFLPTMSFLSFWNGAYNSSNSSNLTYAHQGTIQCQPTITTANGGYAIKYPDGLMICGGQNIDMGSQTFNNDYWGMLNRSNNEKMSANFAATFTTLYSCQVSAWDDGGIGWMAISGNATTSRTQQFKIIKPKNNTTTHNVRMSYIAIGRWK